jgi:hypothetical protein
VHPDPVGRFDAEGLAVEVAGGDDQPAWQDPVLEQPAGPVDVGQQRLECEDTLSHPRLDRLPLPDGDDPRHRVEGERAFLAREREGDAAIEEGAVALRGSPGEVLHRHATERLDEARDRSARPAVGLEDLVPGPGNRVSVEHVPHRVLPSRGM